MGDHVSSRRSSHRLLPRTRSSRTRIAGAQEVASAEREILAMSARGPLMTCSAYRLAVVVLTLIAVAFASTGCTSMRRIPLTTDPSALSGVHAVKAGDTVSVEMKDGRRERFRVDRIEGDALVSTRGMRYSRSDIVVLKRRA